MSVSLKNKSHSLCWSVLLIDTTWKCLFWSVSVLKVKANVCVGLSYSLTQHENVCVGLFYSLIQYESVCVGLCYPLINMKMSVLVCVSLKCKIKGLCYPFIPHERSVMVCVTFNTWQNIRYSQKCLCWSVMVCGF